MNFTSISRPLMTLSSISLTHGKRCHVDEEGDVMSSCFDCQEPIIADERVPMPEGHSFTYVHLGDTIQSLFLCR